jgi:hypothetical protein
MSKVISPSEVSSHNTVETGLYIIIDGDVYSMAGFIDEHPGGSKILKRVGGKDASKQFWKASLICFLFFPPPILSLFRLCVCEIWKGKITLRAKEMLL